MRPGLIRAAWAPLGILAICAAWSAWAATASGGQAGSAVEAAWVGGALVPVVLDAGAQLWRLICAGWLHVDLPHAALNAPGLLVAGCVLARLRGGATVWAVWGLGAAIGCVASWQLTRTWALGASGGNAALAAAVLWIAGRDWGRLTAGDRRGALVGSVPWLVFLLMPRAGAVDHAAHLAGVLAGPCLVGAGARVAVGVAGAQAVAFGLMMHTATRPPFEVITVATAAPPYCRTAQTDGLLIVCQTATAAPAEAAPIEGRAHQRWQIGPQTLLAPPGPRAERALAEIRARFFDGSPDLR